MPRYRMGLSECAASPVNPQLRQSAPAPMRQCAILSMQAMFGLAFDASVALEALSALAVFVRLNASLRDFSENVRARSCFAFVTVQ